MTEDENGRQAGTWAELRRSLNIEVFPGGNGDRGSSFHSRAVG